ncbi:MAG: cytochrome c oxidase subunit 2 [Crocinitomix sp.]|jgi:cytochrome c oxidase subunit 2
MGMKFVVLVVIVLAVIAVAQIMRVYELSSKIRGKREEDIDLRVNNINASLMMIFLIIFFGSFFWMWAVYGNGMLPEPASEMGVEIHWLFNINWIIVIAIFLLCNGLLFVFAWKYSYHPDRKAHWFPHDNKLEMIWTVVPAAVLAVVIILGLMTWNDATGKPSDDAVVVELYAKQFDWTARYSGDDNKLGYADYKLIGESKYVYYNDDADKKNDSAVTYSNPLGLITDNSVHWRVQGLNNEIDSIHTNLEREANNLKAFSQANLIKMNAKVEKLERIRERVLDMVDMFNDSIDSFAADDFVAKELFLIKDQEYFFVLRSQDVLHSAYFPHFRAQMNCVPGQRTSLKIKPIFTTAEMRERVGNPDFNFILMCNKICGVSHSNMKMPVTVGTQEEFEAWKAGPLTSVSINDSIVAPQDHIDKVRMPWPEPAHHGDHDDHEDESHEGDDHAAEGDSHEEGDGH